MKTRFLGAACGCVFCSCVSLSANAASVSGQGTWETTLQGRDLDGNLSTFEAYYDTALNITWLANANAGAGSAFDDGFSSTDGRMTWANANAWAAGLDPYGSGISGWQLPTVNPVNGSSFNYSLSYNGSTDYGYNISAPGSAYPSSTGNEMAHMFYSTLGDKAYYNTSGAGPQAGWGLTNSGPFSNVQSYLYWSAMESMPNGSSAWAFTFGQGGQFDYNKPTSGFYAWAVHSGDVGVAAATSTVPVPATIWLFGSGLLGLAGVARHRRATM